MKKTLALLLLTAVCLVCTAIGQDNDRYERHIKRVLLISIDGMHAVDFANCANGISTINNGAPYCPALAALGKNRHQLRCRQHFKAVGFFSRPDRDHHRRKPCPNRRLL